MTNSKGTTVSISNGTFGAGVYGGSLNVTKSVVNQTQGTIKLSVDDGLFEDVLVGGSLVLSALTASSDVSADGGVEMTIQGGTTNGTIIGGHHSAATAGTISMGNVIINLLGGNINGNVYAAGHIAAAATTESTSVAINESAAFGTVTVSGGFTGAGAAAGVITANRALVFTGTADHGNIATVSFTDFNVVEVQEASGTVTLDEQLNDLDSTLVTKMGAGKLTLSSAQTAGHVAVSAGTLAFSDAATTSTLSSLTINGGNLDVTGTTLSIAGDARISGSAAGSMTMGLGDAGIALGASGTFGRVTASDKMDLTLTGLVAGATVEQTLVTGIDSMSELVNISGFTDNGNGEQSIVANTLIAHLNGDALTNDYYIVHRDNSLVLTNVLTSDLFWRGEGADAVWDMTEAADWHKDDYATGADTIFRNRDNVFFTGNDAKQTITLAGDVIVTDMTVSGGTYTFGNAGDAQRIDVSEELHITGASTSVTAHVIVDLSEAVVAISTGSSLTLSNAADVAIKSLNNSGTLVAAGKLTVTEALAAGGTVSAAGVDLSALADATNSFDKLTSSAAVVQHAGATLSLGGDTSSILSLSGGGLSIESGGTLNITDATATTTLASINNQGVLNTSNGALTLSAPTANGGTVNTGTGAVTLAVTDTDKESVFTQLTAGAVTQDADALLKITGSAASSFASLSGGSLDVATGGGVTIAATGSTTLHAISGAGTLTTGGDLTLTATTAQTIGDLTVNGALTTAGLLTSSAGIKATSISLGGDLIVTGSIDASALTGITINHSLASPAVAPVIKAAGVSFGGAAQDLLFNISAGVLSSTGITGGGSQFIIAELTDASSITNVYINGAGQESETVGVSTYTIRKDGNNIILELSLDGNAWGTSSAGDWSDATKWTANYSPSSPSPADAPTEAILSGAGATINLGMNESASQVRVEAMDSNSTYTLTGADGKLTTHLLEVTRGELELDGVEVALIPGKLTDASSTEITEGNTTVTIGALGKLTLKEGSSLSGDILTLANDGGIDNAGSLLIGKLTAAAGLSLTNTGTLILGDGSSLYTILDDTASPTGTLQTEASSTVTVTTLGNEHVILGTGSTLDVTDDVTLQSMGGSGTLKLTGATGLLTVASTSSAGVTSGNAIAKELMLEAGASATFTMLSVDTVTIEGALDTSTARLSSGSISTSAGSGSVTLDISAATIASLTTGAGGAENIYYVYTQSGASWGNFHYSDDMRKAITDHVIMGNDVLLTQTGDSLTLTIFGDSSATATTGSVYGSRHVLMESAERGQFGVELGVGIDIPVSSGTSSIFLDANYEVRENQSNLNASAGYRFSF